MFHLLLTCLLFTLAVFAGTPIELTAENFDELTHIGANSTGSSDAWMIKYFAPWCPHCRKLAPKWEQLVDEINLKVAEVDCTVEKSLCKRFHVKAYPTILLFTDNKMYKYKGARKVSKLAEFAMGGYTSFEGQEVPTSDSQLRGRSLSEEKSWLGNWF